jgi:hypothetical protein
MLPSKISILKLAIFGIALILLLSFVAVGQQSRFSSKYKKPQAEGLFFVESPDENDSRALVLSSNNKPIPPKANEPDAPTVPGYYLSYTKHLPFEKVEVIGKNVYFKTRKVGGVSYEFRGTAGKENDPEFAEPIQFIKGTMTKFKRGKIVKTLKIKFNHAVIY